jgi:hypothetical protein
MSHRLPIACTLSPAEMPRRAAEIRALGRDALMTVELSEGRAVLRFRADPSTRARVERIVAAESQCCAFMDFDLFAGDDAIVLTIAAPGGGEAPVQQLADLLVGGVRGPA